MRAFASFGAPTDAHGDSARDFTERGSVYQIGLPPRRIDVLTEISEDLVDADELERFEG